MEAEEQVQLQLDHIRKLMSLLNIAVENKNNDNIENIKQVIKRHPLTVSVLSPWGPVSAEFIPGEFKLSLSNGNPVIWIVGFFDIGNRPFAPTLNYRLWGLPRSVYSLGPDDAETLLNYCRVFIFGK